MYSWMADPSFIAHLPNQDSPPLAAPRREFPEQHLVFSAAAARSTRPDQRESDRRLAVGKTHRLLIPEQKADPEDPKRPDELLAADRGGLVFVPKLGFRPNVAELDFVSQFPSIMARFNISPETVGCPCCPDAPRIPELGYRICQKRRGITSRVVERLIAKRTELKKLQKTSE